MAKPKPIDPVEVEKLAAMGCTTKEIASFFDCSRDTIERRFAAILEKGKEKGKAKLRRLQWQSAEKGNVVMQIWLGKNYLGQTDKVEQKSYLNANVQQESSFKQETIEQFKNLVKSKYGKTW